MLDPFMRSGTTLVAAAAAGRAGIEIEIEIEKKYCELAQERIARPCSGPEGAHVPSRSGRWRVLPGARRLGCMRPITRLH